MGCPYCGKKNCIPAVVYSNIEFYGSSWRNFRCKYCSEVIRTFGSLKVLFSPLQKTTAESDW